VCSQGRPHPPSLLFTLWALKHVIDNIHITRNFFDKSKERGEEEELIPNEK
jgi:hypothetical protein